MLQFWLEGNQLLRRLHAALAFGETGIAHKQLVLRVSAAAWKWRRLWCCVKSQRDWWGLQLSGTLASGASWQPQLNGRCVLLSRGLCWSQTLWLSATIICFNTISSVGVSLEARAETLWGPHNDSYRNILKGKPHHKKKDQWNKSRWTRKKKEETMKADEWRKQRQTSGQQVNRLWPEPGREIKSESKLPVTLSPLPLTQLLFMKQVQSSTAQSTCSPHTHLIAVTPLQLLTHGFYVPASFFFIT